METNETISEMFTRFIDIIYGLKSLGKIYTNVKMIRKILKCLPRSWGPKVTAIEEAKDITKMGDELLGSLMTQEITMKSIDESDESKKKKGIAFKASSSQIEEEVKNNDDSDEDMALFTKIMPRLFTRYTML